jgi:glyoxylase-like metal-dependent hydrolase (beta-lactamase superfamily II)
MNSCQQVIDGVYRIRGSRSNIFLVTDPVPVLIDTGMPGDEAVILQALNNLGFEASAVRAVFITHAHLDHVGALAAVKAATGAKLVASMHENDHIEGRRMLCSMRREGLGGKLFKCILFLMEKFVQKYVPARIDSPYCEEGGSPHFDGIDIIATPGHSPGSLSYYLPKKKAIFTGDALTGMPTPGLPLRAGCSDYVQALSSVRRLAGLEPEVCLFGHGDPVIGNAPPILKQLADRAASIIGT